MAPQANFRYFFYCQKLKTCQKINLIFFIYFLLPILSWKSQPSWIFLATPTDRGNYITFYSILSTDLLVSHHLVCQLHNLPAFIFLPHSLAQLAWLFQHHWRRGYNGSPAGELRGPCVEFVHQGSPGASEERWAVRTTGEDLLSQDY